MASWPPQPPPVASAAGAAGAAAWQAAAAQQQQARQQQQQAWGWQQHQQYQQAYAQQAQQAPQGQQSRPGQPGSAIGAPQGLAATAQAAASGAQAAPVLVVPVGAGGAATQVDSYVVHTKANDTHEVVIRTLIGDFFEHGSNHGRKVYKKLADKSGETVDVYLYYWDGRDGPVFEGWWFGNKLGGTQVWSHCTSDALTPPATGWKIPWDGGVRNTLCCDNKAAQQRAQSLEKLSAASKEVQEAGAAAKKALEDARAAHQGAYTFIPGLSKAEEFLAPQVNALSEALNKVMDGQRTATGDAARQFQQLVIGLRSAQQQVSSELNKIKTSKQTAETSAKQKAAEQKDAATLNEVLPEATQKTNAAEDAVEKAVIAAEMIEAGGEDLEGQVRQAVLQTEHAVQEAQKAIGEARIFLNAKQASARLFESEVVKQQAVGELSKLQNQLQEAQTKLNPLKSVRSDFAQKSAAQQLVTETLEKLTPAEVEVDRAEEATLMLNGETAMTKELMQQAEQAVSKAASSVEDAMQFIAEKKSSAEGVAKAELLKLENRAQASQQRLTQLKTTHKEAMEKGVCESLVKEANEKLQLVQETVSKAADAEGPFLMGVEELPLEETLAAVKACETAASKASTAVSISRMFLAAKTAEAKSFTQKSAWEVNNKLKDFQKQLDNHSKRLESLKASTASRRKKSFMREAEDLVGQAEEAAKAMAKAAACFEDGSKLGELGAAVISAAQEETAKCEAVATEKVGEARKYINTRQEEAKQRQAPTEVIADIIKFSTRINAAQGEVSKCKGRASSIGDRLQALKAAEDVGTKITSVEEKVAASHSATKSLKPDDAADSQVAKDADTSLTASRAALKEVQQVVTELSSKGTAPKELMVKLHARIEAMQGKMSECTDIMKTRADHEEVKVMIAEAGGKAKEAEAAVTTAAAAESPFLTGEEMLPLEDTKKALKCLEEAIEAAQKVVSLSRTFVTTKRMSVKKLAEAAATEGAAAMARQQERVDASTKKLQDVKNSLARRKLDTMKREVAVKIEETWQVLKAATEATAMLVQDGEGLVGNAMKSALTRGSSTQRAAVEAISAAREYLDTKQAEARATSGDATALAELARMSQEIDKIQVALDTQTGNLREQEHKFVAQRLVQDATDMVEKLEQRLKSTTETAGPLVSEEKEDFTAIIFLNQIVEALRQHMTDTSKTSDKLFSEMSGGAATADVAQFLAFLGKVPELNEQGDSLFTSDELLAAFKRIDAKGAGSISKEQFDEQFRKKFMVTSSVLMTSNHVVKGGKPIRKLEVNEIIEALEEPQQEPNLKLMRVQVRAKLDSKQGYVSMQGNQGTEYITEHDPFVACNNRVERTVQELLDTANTTQRYVDKKANELASVGDSPLSKTKDVLLALKPRIADVQQAQVQLKGKVAVAQKAHQDALQAEKVRREFAVERRTARVVTEGAQASSKAAEEQVDKAVSSSEALIKLKSGDAGGTVAAFEQAEGELTAALNIIDEAEAKMVGQLEELKTATKGPFLEARSSVNKLKVRVQSLASRCKKHNTALSLRFQQIEEKAHGEVIAAIRTHVKEKQLTADALFASLGGSESFLGCEAFRVFVGKLGSSLAPCQLDFALQRYSAGVTKMAILTLLQRYLRCVAEIAITSTFDVKEGKTLRKILLGELAEVVGEEKIDEETGLARCSIRALSDGTDGWVSLRGNQGTNFMERCPKPFFVCDDEVLLQAGFESISSEVRRLQAGEVLELVEGPRKENTVQIQRIRGRALSDNKSGWVTMKDTQDSGFLEPAKVLVCRQTVALTPDFDIKEGKPMRKLEIGDVMEILGEMRESEQHSMARIQVRTQRDKKEGWVTIKGNQGTGFVEESDRHYICRMNVPLEQRFECGSALVRTLQVGELFEVSEGPRTETKDGASRVKGRNFSDGSVGWFNCPSDVTLPWIPSYMCKRAIHVTDGLDIATAKNISSLEPGDKIEALDTPVVEKASGMLRIRVRSGKDSTTGFATLRSSQGSIFLEPVPPEASQS